MTSCGWSGELSRVEDQEIDKVRIGENSGRVAGKKISQKILFEIFCNRKQC